MLRDTVEESWVEIESAPTWAGGVPSAPGMNWRTVDRALRAIRRRRSVLDAEEARWLRAAEELQIWRPLGMVSALDYLERALGYAPRTAQDRLRVARALGALPGLTAALASDELSYSAVRELTRVATPSTEDAWLAAAAGKNLRQVEELVADHKPGDRPDDPPDPEARMRVVRFELSPETFALLRQARTALDNEHGTHLADDDFVAALCSAVLDGGAAVEPAGRAKFQVAVTVCSRCRQGWQEGAGVRVAIDAAAVGRAMCDAQHIGSLDGREPERAHQDIPPSVVRLVWRRDGGRCRVPGCRSARGLEVHHIVHRADGGDHEAENLCLLCSSCHGAHHRGALAIRGTAEHLEVRRPGESAASGERRSAGEPSRTIDETEAVCDGTHADAAAPSTTDGAHHRGALAIRGTAELLEVRRPGESAASGERRSAGDPSRTIDETEAVCDGAHADAAAPSATDGAHVGAASLLADKAYPGCVGKAGLGHMREADPSVRCENAIVRTSARDSAGAASSRARAGRRELSKFDDATLRVQAKTALTTMGWKPAIARAAVDAAITAHGEDLPLGRLIVESLRRCPVRRM